MSVEGSSPLTRGKLSVVVEWFQTNGLIPAHAGKTRRPDRSRSSSRAHPRSRGENLLSQLPLIGGGGSSPLTRGKPVWRGVRIDHLGLIPAHAGKTPCPTVRLRRMRAHPRSRGENQQAAIEEQKAKGSSPLTRGKRTLISCRIAGVRLIPAHAGKTRGIERRRVA